jgi:predicted nucleic acid-binding protein
MRYLADTSFIARTLTDKAVRTQWAPIIDAGLVAICEPVELELLYSARSVQDAERVSALLASTYSWVPVPDHVWRDALHTQRQMTHRGTHRSAGPIDLVIAATAAAHGLAVLAADGDFTCVADVAGQPVHVITSPPR